MIHQIYADNDFRNFSYLIEGDNGIYCVDPFDGKQILQYLAKLKGKLKAILNTHEHWDHICGNEFLVKETKCPVWALSTAKDKFSPIDRYLQAGEIIPLGGESEIEIMDAPGHTMAHFCLLIKTKGVAQALISGDTLFNAGVGNCHNGGDPATLYETISSKIMALPDDVKVYPGHDYLESNLKFTLSREPSNIAAQKLLEEMPSHNVTSIGEEKKINTFLRLNSSEIIQNLESNTKNDKEIFLRLREYRNKW